jgi:hypothetical protein
VTSNEAGGSRHENGFPCHCVGVLT